MENPKLEHARHRALSSPSAQVGSDLEASEYEPTDCSSRAVVHKDLAYAVACGGVGVAVTDSYSGRDLAIRVVAATLGASGGLAGPGGAAAGTALTPLIEVGLARVVEELSSRRRNHAADTLMDAAQAAGAGNEEEFLKFVDAAVSDERRQELLARTLIIAQDTALRDKRRALGRALAAGVADSGTRVDEELLFIRVLDDLDEPHIRLLRLMNTASPHLADQGEVGAWMPSTIGDADSGLRDAAYAMLVTLERHNLVWTSGEEYHTAEGSMEPEYTITRYGQWLLERLADPSYY